MTEGGREGGRSKEQENMMEGLGMGEAEERSCSAYAHTRLLYIVHVYVMCKVRIRTIRIFNCANVRFTLDPRITHANLG